MKSSAFPPRSGCNCLAKVLNLSWISSSVVGSSLHPKTLKKEGTSTAGAGVSFRPPMSKVRIFPFRSSGLYLRGIKPAAQMHRCHNLNQCPSFLLSLRYVQNIVSVLFKDPASFISAATTSLLGNY
jgi:hypothetical protein